MIFISNNSVFLPLKMQEMDQEGVAGNGPDCLSIANGAQAAHVTGTPNVYRMDRSVFQVLQERSPACQDCRCSKRPCARHTSSSSCATFFARNARVWRQYPKNDLRHDLVWETYKSRIFGFSTWWTSILYGRIKAYLLLIADRSATDCANA